MFSTTGRMLIMKRTGAMTADIVAQNPGKDMTKLLAGVGEVEAKAEEMVSELAQSIEIEYS